MLAATVVVGRGIEPVAVLLIIVSALVAWHRWILSWQVVLSLVLAVVLFVPVGRYSIGANTPFSLDLYRLAIALVLLAWTASLLVDPRVRLRRTALDAPILLIVAATLGGVVINHGRVAPLSAAVLKSLLFFLSFVALYFFITSVVRTAGAVVAVTKFIVSGVAALAFLAVVEQRTGLNVFDHVRAVLPFLQFQGSITSDRYGLVRAVGSADHPIALGVLFAMAVPLGVALAKSRSPAWWAPSLMIMVGVLATASRTPVIAIAVAAVVLLWLRPRELTPLLPLVIPMLIVIKIVAPGSLATLKNSFLPQSGPGLIAGQRTLAADPTLISGRANFKPRLIEGMHRPIFGQGLGTRQVGAGNPLRNAPVLDNQWLSLFLDIGLLGVAGWIWLFVRIDRRLGRIARTRGSPEGWLAAALVASITGFAVSMATYDSLAFVQETVVLWVLLALAATLVAVCGENNGSHSTPTT